MVSRPRRGRVAPRFFDTRPAGAAQDEGAEASGSMTEQSNPVDNVLPAKRRHELLRLVQARGQVTVTDLCSLFDVSTDTVRRDLDLLARQGLIKRTHGGAVPIGLVTEDTPFAQRLIARKDAKRRIGRLAASLIASNETLIINGGSTTLAFATELGGLADLNVVTNNLSIPNALPTTAVRDVYLLGGEIRFEAQVTIGAVGFAGTGSISADTAVLGVGGVSASGGISTTLLHEASMIAAMMAASRRTIILADSSKFGHNAFAHIAPLDKIDVVVTEAEPPADLARTLAEAGVEVLVAPG
jgi:DeoR/GlpR family transcriptional regulator of sugar metabolism